MKSLVAVVFLAMVVSVWAQFEDPSRADTARADTSQDWPDTTITFADSTAAHHATMRHGWLYPMGIVMVTCMGFLMLFTMRSR